MRYSEVNEIIQVPEQPESRFIQYKNNITDEMELGKSENFVVFKGHIEGLIAMVARTESGEFMGYTIGEYITILGKHHFQTKYTYFTSVYQRKGYATALYMFIVKKMNTPIISDEAQSPAGQRLWMAISKYSECKIYDRELDMMVSYESVPHSRLYSTNAYDGERYYLVLEQFPAIARGYAMCMFEHQIYTNPINKFE